MQPKSQKNHHKGHNVQSAPPRSSGALKRLLNWCARQAFSYWDRKKISAFCFSQVFSSKSKPSTHFCWKTSTSEPSKSRNKPSLQWGGAPFGRVGGYLSPFSDIWSQEVQRTHGTVATNESFGLCLHSASCFQIWHPLCKNSMIYTLFSSSSSHGGGSLPPSQLRKAFWDPIQTC